VTLIFCAI